MPMGEFWPEIEAFTRVQKIWSTLVPFIWYTLGMKKLLILFVIVMAMGCRYFQPMPSEVSPFKERAVSRFDGDLHVKMVALGGEESKQVFFGANLFSNNIQPVWIEIINMSAKPYWLFPMKTDPNYYSPAEVAYITRYWFWSKRNKQLNDQFKESALSNFIPPKTTKSGFLFTQVDPGLKYIDVTLLGLDGFKSFRSVVEVPGIRADYQEVDLENLYSADEITECDEKALREELNKLPCCTTNKDGSRNGDPLNLVFIGDLNAVLTALIGGGWEVTEELSFRSVWLTIRSFLLREEYRHAPVSSLYVFGRPQDAAFQKARGTVKERNHLRIWLTPLRYKDQPVWIGQISRDIGVKFTLKTGFLTTHVIDPDVDSDRFYLIQTVATAEALSQLGYVKGVGPVTVDDGRSNLGGDVYFTDGLRAVLHCSETPVSLSDVRFFNWEFPPDVAPYAKWVR